MTGLLRCVFCLARAGSLARDAVTVTKGEAVCRDHLTVLYDREGRIIDVEPNPSGGSTRRNESEGS